VAADPMSRLLPPRSRKTTGHRSDTTGTGGRPSSVPRRRGGGDPTTTRDGGSAGRRHRTVSAIARRARLLRHTVPTMNRPIDPVPVAVSGPVDVGLPSLDEAAAPLSLLAARDMAVLA
jgi:hypothetical protein